MGAIVPNATLMKEGDRVKLKADAALRVKHPELADAVGVVSTTFSDHGTRRFHVRFAPPVNCVAMYALADEFEPADNLEPRLRLV